MTTRGATSICKVIVTGVQTCALPISGWGAWGTSRRPGARHGREGTAMNRFLTGLAVVWAVAASGCSEPPAAPASGTFSAQLANAGSADRALLVQLVGADTSARIDSVLTPAGSSYRLFTERQSATQWRAIVTGNLTDGVLLRLAVPERSEANAYTATILDVADAAFASLPPGARAVTIAR